MEIATESKKTYLRGINEKLAKKFKESSLCPLVKEDKGLLTCIRNNAIGIYHLADKVAMVHCNREGELVCDVNDFYVSGKHTSKNKKRNDHGQKRKMPLDRRHTAASRRPVAPRSERPLGTLVALRREIVA